MIITLSRDNSLYDLEKSYGAILFNNIENEKNENLIMKLINYQKEQKKSGNKLKQYLLLFDDFILSDSFNKKRGIYDLLYSQARHYSISVITTSQQVTLLPSSIRRMSWYDICFKISNTSEKKIYIYENCNAINKSELEFEEIFDEATIDPYSFLYLDKNKNTYSKRFGI